jgi:hypothetical protein
MADVYIPSTRGIVKQLLLLASDPDNHDFIFKEDGESAKCPIRACECAGKPALSTSSGTHTWRAVVQMMR